MNIIVVGNKNEKIFNYLNNLLFISGIPLDVLLLGVTNGQVGLESWPKYTLDETADAIASLPLYMCAEYKRVTIYTYVQFS